MSGYRDFGGQSHGSDQQGSHQAGHLKQHKVSIPNFGYMLYTDSTDLLQHVSVVLRYCFDVIFRLG